MYKAKSNIKRKAITTNDTCQEILGAELQNISTTAVNLPAMKDIKKIIRRHRFKIMIIFRNFFTSQSQCLQNTSFRTNSNLPYVRK